MSRLGDFLNNIKNRIMGNRIPQLPKTDEFQKQVKNQVEINPILKEKINSSTLLQFENPNNYNEYCRQFFSQGNNFSNQYGYLEVVSQMQQNGAMDDFERYYIEIQNNAGLYYPSKVHGIDHTSRVTFFAEMLCSIDGISGHEKDLIMRAAQLHDIGREDDGKNFDHGLASRYKIEQFGILNKYPPKDQEIIKFAVECHSLEPEQVAQRLQTIPSKDRANYKLVLDYLQDADKLDRTRIANKGWGLDPNRLASDTAKKLVKVAHTNYFEFHNVIDYELNREKYIENYNTKVDAFNQVRKQGYNISFEDFHNIINEYEPGIFEKLMQEGRIEDIFSYDTFLKYSASETAEAIKKEHDIIFEELNQNDQIQYLEETYNSEFMLYYNLKLNHPKSYELYKYVDIDISAKSAVGVASQIKISDLDKLFAKGYYLRATDLFYLASNLTPEEYRATIDSGKIEDLFSSKYEKNPINYENIERKLKENGINYDKSTIDRSYRFIEEIVSVCPQILKSEKVSNYSFPEIYAAITKIKDTKYRISQKRKIEYSIDDIFDLMDFSRKDSLLYNVSEKEQLDIVEKFMINKQDVIDPRFVQYMVKKNRPYNTNNIEEILNYNEFCADSILVDNNITLQEAKSKLIDGLFNIDVPPKDKAKFEQEIVEELYYHKKYFPQSELYQDGSNVTTKIADILSAKNIREFKNLLYESRKAINEINTHNLGTKIKSELIDISRQDVVHKLQETASQIRQMEPVTVYSNSGKSVQVKVLSGQPFYLATSTAMPKCSSLTHKILSDRGGNDSARRIYDEMLKREIDPNQICTSIVSDKMVAHAASALPDQELKYGFVPDRKENISIAGMYDLATTKRNTPMRHTNKPVTPRGLEDFIAGTTEEHNEIVMDAYPDFIVCYDSVSDIAIEKQKAIQREYNQKGIDKKVEIVLVEARDKYIPQIKDSVAKEHAYIEDKLKSGTLTLQDFSLMFERHESNFVLRTLQSMHSTSYRTNIWNPSYNRNVLDSMTNILAQVSQIVPNDRARSVLNQVDILLQRANRNTDYGSRFYDHSYAEDINTLELERIYNKLSMQVYSYERGENTKKSPQLQVEELNTDAVKQENNKQMPETMEQRNTSHRDQESPADDGR